MNKNNETPQYIASLFKPTAKKQSARKVWSIDLETVWLPFFVASNTKGVTQIPHEAIGCPLRLGYNTDGSVKFSKAGRPIIRVAKEISQSVTLVRENFVAGLQNYTQTVRTENEEAYNATVKNCIEAGKPIADNDKDNLEKAMAQMVEEAIAEAEAKQAEAETTKAHSEKELVHV
jgi:hypothetical protein